MCLIQQDMEAMQVQVGNDCLLYEMVCHADKNYSIIMNN